MSPASASLDLRSRPSITGWAHWRAAPVPAPVARAPAAGGFDRVPSSRRAPRPQPDRGARERTSAPAAAVGVAGEHIRRRDLGAVEQPLQLIDLVGGIVNAGDREAIAEPGAVIGAGPGDPADLGLNVTPGVAAVAEARFQHDRRGPGPHALEVQAAAAADGDELAGAHAAGSRTLRRRPRAPPMAASLAEPTMPGLGRCGVVLSRSLVACWDPPPPTGKAATSASAS